LQEDEGMKVIMKKNKDQENKKEKREEGRFWRKIGLIRFVN
jgi:hypothetical protein